MDRMDDVLLGPFVWRPDTRQLTLQAQAMPLSEQAAAILAVLAQSLASAVSAQRLLELAGRAVALDERGLWSGVSAINSVFASYADGTCFVGHHPQDGFSLQVSGPQQASGSPLRQAVVGRDDAIQHTMRQLQAHRFVTLLGAGGMGKTTVALAVARQMGAGFPDGVFTVDLSPMGDGRLVPFAVGTSMGVASGEGDVLARLAAFVRNKRLLLVLDSCEHVAEQAAAVAEAVLGSGAEVHVLATSREPLAAAGERLYRLPALGVPAPGLALTALQAMGHSAVELFVQRVKARHPGFTLDAEGAQSAVNVCRRLDGIPLAIEIAAARASELGLAGLSQQLDDRLLFAQADDRNAPARHQTLSAMMDWSHDQLAPRDQAVLRQLSIFRGNFSLDAAMAVVGGPEIPAEEAADAVLDLVGKCLVARNGAGGFRLLDTTRAYASAKLPPAERSGVAERHARFMLLLLRQADADWLALSVRQWLDRYAVWIDDVRLALDSCFMLLGDERLGVDMAFASFPLARQMSLNEEFRGHMERALDVLVQREPREFRPEITLRSYLGSMGQRLDRERTPQHVTLIRILESEGAALRAPEQVIALGSINHASLMSADFALANRWGEQAFAVASRDGDPVAHLIARRMLAQSMHFMGRHGEAKAHAQFVLESSGRKIPLNFIPTPVEHRVSMRILLARIMWMEGLVDGAQAMAEECLQHAASDTAIAQCQALAMCALPLALWRRDFEAARTLASRLRQLAENHSIAYWHYWAERIELVLALQAAGANGVPDAHLFRSGAVEANLSDHLCTFDDRLLAQDVVDRVDAGTVGWCAPEVLRVQALAAMAQGPSLADRAEALLRQSIALSRQQQALAWELRASTALAKVLAGTGRVGDARLQLVQTLARLSQGHGSADARDALGLVASLDAPG